MELTIEQALQQGVTAHKEGKLQEAELLYRAILRSQPAHPDANHNLGVIAVSVNKAEAALPLFKAALEANPKIEQFWLSYIDALIKEKQFENVKAVLEQAKQQRVDAGRLNSLEAQLFPETQIENVNTASPSQEKLISLLGHYQNGRLAEAEKLAQSITQQFPQHPFAWKALGVIFGQTGRTNRAADANQTAVALSPHNTEAHSNLGNTFRELGRLDEALSSYTEAIALQPDYAEAHSNLGITLKELGRSDEAEVSLRRAIALKPSYAEAHSNLGITLKELGRLDEALASYTQAIALKPDYAEAYSNLGITLQELGRLDEAETSHKQAIALKPEDFKTHERLLMCLFQQNKKSVFFDELDYLIDQDKASAIIGSLTCRSSLKYGLEKPNIFCTKPLNYVLHNDLNARYDFEKTFVKKAKSILNEIQILNKRQALLVNGNQTLGNIFDIKKDDTNEIQNIIRTEVEKYRARFKKSEEGLIKRMPIEYSLYGWLINMKSGGNLKPHIHTEGWLSGSIYINVPQKLKVDSGNLVVAIGEDSDSTDTRINEKKTINVVTGSMVLFPSSLTHYTIPFESEEERIVLAFDVIKR